MSQVPCLIATVSLLLTATIVAHASIPPPRTSTELTPIIISKCCKEHEIIVNNRCTAQNSSEKYPAWIPPFMDDAGTEKVQPPPLYTTIIGIPVCKTRQHVDIYQNPEVGEKLAILSNGKLRHYVKSVVKDEAMSTEETEDEQYNDYNHDEYCIDKIIINNVTDGTEYAIICHPVTPLWHRPDYIIRRIINPICHGIAIACLLTVAVIYFVLPQLCDLVGNIVTSIMACLVICQAADLVRIFTEFNSEISYLVAETAMYTSIMGAFFWLNSLGYYIWKTFRSRNVFLRITDGRKYCYYSMYVWSTTLTMCVTALFAHFVLDTTKSYSYTPSFQKGSIGWLGISVFFIPLTITVLINIFFYISTVKVKSRISSYGRIHHKLKYNFRLFVKLFSIMTANWLVYAMTWLPYDGLFYFHILMNLLQAVLLLYVCVIDLKRVRFLMSKACCHGLLPCCKPVETGEAVEWGEEMMAMNANTY